MADKRARAGPPEAASNRLLDTLPLEDRDRWFTQLIPRFIELKAVLLEPGRVIDHVYFPLTAVVALVTPMEDGAIVEVATVGREGIVGVPLVPGGSLAVRAVAQLAGWVLPVESGLFLESVADVPAVRDLVSDYVQALISQVAQVATCNRLHSNEERLARWLLMTQDRAAVDEFPITHDFLGQLLGSRRPTVSLSAGYLETAGLITLHRGRVTIVDRPGLEAVTCECYAVIRGALDDVVDKAYLRGRGSRGRAELRGRAARAESTTESGRDAGGRR